MEGPNIKNLAWKVALPVIIGIAVVAWLFHDEFAKASWSSIHIGWHTVAGIALACLFVLGKDFGLTWRFHTIASPDLPWRRALRVDLMCAFTSAITPSAVGGSALAIFYLNREGVSVGRATTLTLTTLFLDEMFFVVFCPIIVLLIPFDQLFGNTADSVFLQGVQLVFWLVYAGIVAYTALLYAGIILCPQAVQRALAAVFRLRWLRRWLPAVEGMTENMVQTSAWVKQRNMRWWLNVFGATTLSWFSRYFIVNALFWAFAPGTSMLLVFARQFVVWVLLMVSPTPGGSGVSEWIFTEYYGDMLGSGELALVIALVWRLITYYDYLVAGICLVPSYFMKKKQASAPRPPKGGGRDVSEGTSPFRGAGGWGAGGCALAIIPARMASTRLPGKPLADICGKPMVQWVYEHAAEALGSACVATADEALASAVEAFGGMAVLTGEHPNGTSRVAEACRLLGISDDTVVVNVQGDEPLLAVDDIRLVASLVASGADIATLMHDCSDPAWADDADMVKVRVDSDGRAVEFARSMPFGRCNIHIGVYAFRAGVLQALAALPPSAAATEQRLEQIAWLEAGYSIATATASRATVGVDTPDDLANARIAIKNIIDNNPN